MDSAMPPIASHNERLASQRVDARGLLTVESDGARTRLRHLVEDGAAKIRFPFVARGPLQAVLINTAGGLTGGDRVAWEIAVGAAAAATLTTQASEKIYRAGSGHAGMSVRLSVGAGGRMSWLPQESILFDGAYFNRRLDVALEKGAELLMAEATVFGRSAMGETVTHGAFRDRWRVRIDGRLVHAEDFAVDADVSGRLQERAILCGAVAMATVLVVSDQAEAMLDPVRAIVADEGGASFWRVGGAGKLLARLYAGDGYRLRKRLMPLLALLNGQAGLPKAWSL